MRQLQALDQSLQRVTRNAARGKDDAAVRKSVDWNPNLILSELSWDSNDWGSISSFSSLPPRILTLQVVLRLPTKLF
jgi:hypothetical protein